MRSLRYKTGAEPGIKRNMAKTLDNRVPTNPGLDGAGIASRYLQVGVSEAQDFGFPANIMARDFESVGLGNITSDSGPALAATGASGAFTVTLDGSCTTTNTSTGFLLTTPATSGAKVVVRSNRKYPVATTSKRVVGKWRLAIDTITTNTAFVGFTNTTTDPVGTAPTDGVFFKITNGAIVGTVRGASGTAVSTATLLTLTGGTMADLDIKFYNTGTAATSNLEFWVNGTKTAGTPAQVAQLVAMTADLYHLIHIQPTAAAVRLMTVDFAMANYDR